MPVERLIRFVEKHIKLILFILVYIVYISNEKTIGSGDTIPASLLPFSILENHNLYLDQFNIFFIKFYPQPIFWVKEMNGHYLSTYPIVTPILITPLYIFSFLLMKLIHIPVDLFHPGFATIVGLMEKLTAAFITSLSVIFVFLSLKELINQKTAIITALIFAFATNTWATSSQGLWQHGLVELLLAIMIYLVILNEKQQSNRLIIYLGVLSGLFLFNRPVDTIFLIPIAIYILGLKDRRIVYYVCGAFLSGTPFLFYNIYYYRNLFGGYPDVISQYGFDLIIGLEPIYRTLGLLISPSRGLFIYTPIILFSILGYFKLSQMPATRLRTFLMHMGISVLGLMFIYSLYYIWWAGVVYGPRFLTSILPIAAIYMGLYIKDIDFNMKDKKNVISLVVFSTLLVLSIFIQVVGVFYYPNGGDINSKLWDWGNSQIISTFYAGVPSHTSYLQQFQFILNYRFSI